MSEVKWSLLPDGLYPAEIVGSRLAPLKSGCGVGLSLECRLEG